MKSISGAASMHVVRGMHVHICLILCKLSMNTDIYHLNNFKSDNRMSARFIDNTCCLPCGLRLCNVRMLTAKIRTNHSELTVVSDMKGNGMVNWGNIV
jgi:hypothetical protein